MSIYELIEWHREKASMERQHGSERDANVHDATAEALEELVQLLEAA